MDKQELNEMNIADEKITNAFFDIMWENMANLSDEEVETVTEAYLTIMAII